MKCTVVENVKGIRKKAPLHLIRFTTDKYVDFEPGDLVDVTVDKFPKRNRQYSLAGRWPDGTYDFIVRDAGSVGNHLCNLVQGDTFIAEYIGGIFHPKTDSVWISSGSGMAPFRAAILNGTQHFHYFCNIDSAEEDENITPSPGTKHIVYSAGYDDQRATLKDYVDTLRTRQVYVCGSGRYVTEICSYLGELGVSIKYIETDIYGAATD